MQEKIKYSVIVPVFNAENYLTDCIESVLNQTYSNFELILVNDGSADSSGDISEHYSTKDHRIKVCHQKNKGHTLARKKGIEIATGDYFLFLDSDDFWDLNLLSTINKSIELYNCELVIFRLKRVSESGMIISENPCLFENETTFDKQNVDELFNVILRGSQLNHLVCKVIEKKLVDKLEYTGIVNVKTGEDLLQSLPIIINSKKTIYLSHALYNYRTNETSITRNFYKNAYEDISLVRLKVLDCLMKLQMDSAQNLIIFYRTYLKSILDYIFQLLESELSNKEKIKIIKKIKEKKIYYDAVKQKDQMGFSKGYLLLIEILTMGNFYILLFYTKILTYYRKNKKINLM